MKVPKKYKEGGPTKYADLKKGQELPPGAVLGPAPGGGTLPSGRIVDDSGKVVGYYHIPKSAASPIKLDGTGPGKNEQIAPSVAKSDFVPAIPEKLNLIQPPATPTSRNDQREALKKSLESWQNASAQKVPTDIVNEIQNNIRPNVQAKQAILDAAAAKKYGSKSGPVKGQQLSYDEAAAALGGKEAYDDFLGDIYAYEAYRKKTTGTYDTQNVTWGATDPNEKMYGFRMSNMFKNSPEQSAANIKKTPTNVLDWQKNPTLPGDQAMKKADPKTILLDNNNEAIPVMTYDADGNPIIKKVEKPITAFKKGGKVPKGYKKIQKKAEGGPIDPSMLSPEQLAQYNALTSVEDKAAMLADPNLLTGAAKTATPNIPYGMLGNLAGNAVDQYVQVDPDENNQEIGKAMAAGALKGAGTGAAMASVIPGVGTAIGAGVGALVGGTAGFIKGKKKARTYDEEVGTENIDSAQGAEFKLSGRKEGGPIVGPGTAKSDSIKAEIKAGSFIIPAENAKAAERLRKLYLTPSDKAKLKQPGGAPVKVSNGEHSFSPEEVAILEGRGVNLDALAPNQEDGKYGLQKGGPVQELKKGGEVKDLSDAELKKQRDAIKAEIESLSGPGANLAERSMLQAAKEKKLAEFDAELKQREIAKVNTVTDFSPEAIKNATGQTSTSTAPKPDAQKLLDDAFKNPETGKDITTSKSTTTLKPKPVSGTGTGTSNVVERELTPQEKAAQEIFQNLHSGQPLAPLPSIAASAKLPSTTEPIAQIAQQGADATIIAQTGQAPPAPASGVQKVFESLGGAAGLAAVGQVGLGAYFASKDKMPVDKVDPQLLEARNRAQQNATFGFTPELMAQQKARIESNRRGVVGNISQFSGGNVGLAVGNSRMATIDANQANLGLAAASQQAQQQKQGYADNLTSQVAQANRQVFVDSRQNVLMNQQVGANLIGAGLSNLFGSMQYKDQQNRIDDRMNKYGRDPWTNYATQPAV